MQHDERDLRLAMGLLTDAVRVGDDGVLRSHRVEPESPEEREARRAVVRLLWAWLQKGCPESVPGPVWGVCLRLMRVLDPDNEAEPFELRLQRRRGRKGPVISPVTEGLIVSCVLGGIKNGQHMKVAIRDAMDRFGVKERTVWDILKKYDREADEARERGSNVVVLQNKRSSPQ
jgi:hypothetical protein